MILPENECANGIFLIKKKIIFFFNFSVIKQVLQVINYAHLKGIAHRDIKLENIMINKKIQENETDY